MTVQLSRQMHWIACVSGLMMWAAWGYPLLKAYLEGVTVRDYAISPSLFIPMGIFGAAMLAGMALKLRPAAAWTLIWVQLAAVVAMAIILPWAGVSHFLVIIAWQVAVVTTPRKAFGWALFQTAAIIAALAQAISPDLCWVITKSFALQLLLLLMARALKREAETACALEAANQELRAAQAIIAVNVRDAERVRISRELHDAWGHELTALGLQLEIASNVAEPDRAGAHVQRAKDLSRALLGKVRDVVATLREEERFDLKGALEALADRVPTPEIHIAIAPGLQVAPEQAHALIRCAQEAVTNAVRHANATNLWLQVTSDHDGVRLVARNDGEARKPVSAPGSGLVGMRERVESLGGRLRVEAGRKAGFTIDAWLPAITPQPA